MWKKMTAVLLLVMVIFSCAFPVSAEEQAVQEEIIYHIMVDRFNNGDRSNDEQVNTENPNAYQGGDLQGIIMKLDDLQEIGVTTLVLSPIMANAPDGFHGYWIEDFFAVEEQFGTMKDLQELVGAAHERGMKVVLEFVTNYAATSYSQAADTNWTREAADVTADWAEQTVALNQENTEVAAHLLDAAQFWMQETNIDGFQLHAVDQASPEFLQIFTEEIKEINPDFYLFGDILMEDENREEILRSTALDAIDNPTMHEVMADVFAQPGVPVSEIYQTWEEAGSNSDILYMDHFYSERFTQKLAENGRNNLTAWTLALTYMYTAPGVPQILQGTELSMYGEDAQDSQRLVPFNSGNPELTEFHNRISSLKHAFPALSLGEFEMVGSSGAMSVFKRSYEHETMFIAINNDTESQMVPVTDVAEGMQLRGYLADNIVREDANGEFKIAIPRESTEVYVVEPDRGLNWGLIGFAGGVILLFIGGVAFLSYKQRKRNKAESV
ncbi:alpha-amylase family glycosyl hydrolase [Lentibacillus sediminis]|uniref:alpha-amylase family glycosyl hydrolase n=1 Tax=Lentibacillus sediminis TaxID=1940529 RepID=UPI000C1C1E35|nr:alpha-amylase family glycosyl hydrolase [Lentibacillus sediminis]